MASHLALDVDISRDWKSLGSRIKLFVRRVSPSRTRPLGALTRVREGFCPNWSAIISGSTRQQDISLLYNLQNFCLPSMPF
eukprot:jgi/Botrbrau1/14110/Bobra.182_3s0053.1